MRSNAPEKDEIEVQCTNASCQKVFRINKDKMKCDSCGSDLKVKSSALLNTKNGMIVTAIILGGTIAWYELPDRTRTAENVIQIYEGMNACMRYASNYQVQRKVCACALTDAMNSYTVADSGKKQFNYSLESCNKSNQ